MPSGGSSDAVDHERQDDLTRVWRVTSVVQETVERHYIVVADSEEAAGEKFAAQGGHELAAFTVTANDVIEYAIEEVPS